MRISLVGTIHAERGQANAKELGTILERIHPEVIFAEIPASHINRYMDGSHGNLEAITVTRHLANRQVAVIPIDLAEPEQSFFDDSETMFNAVERTSRDYRRLVDHHSAQVQADGFHYLNSDRCIQAWADIHREVLATIDWIRDDRFRAIYDRWCQQNERRDREMLRNIVDYLAQHPIDRGAFLIGAAHRKSIIDKAFARSEADLPRIEWDLDGFLGR